MAKIIQSKVTTLTGAVKDATGDTTIVSLSATISSDPEVPTSYTETINNTNLYYSDITSVRVEVDKFNAEKRKLEDDMLAERSE